MPTSSFTCALLGGDDDEELSSGSESESESEEDEDTGLTENQNRLLYMISLYTKKATPHTDEGRMGTFAIPSFPHPDKFTVDVFFTPYLTSTPI